MTPQEAMPNPRAAPVPLPKEFWPLLGVVAKLTLKNFLRQLPYTLVFMLLTFVLYFYLIVVKYDGFDKTGNAGLIERIMGLGNGSTTGISGAAVLMVLSGLAVGLVVSTLRVGPAKAIGNFFRTPQSLGRYWREAGEMATATLLGSAGVAMVVSYVLSGWAGLALAVGLGALVASKSGQAVSLLLRTAWCSAFGVAQGGGSAAHGAAAGYVALFGGSLGFVCSSVLPATISFLAGAALLVLAIVLGRTGGRKPVPAPDPGRAESC